MGNPIGQEFRTEQDAMQFVRDPGGLVADKTFVRFNPSTKLPPEAHFTGLRYEDFQVWVANDLDKAIYILRGDDTVELWPRVHTFIACG